MGIMNSVFSAGRMTKDMFLLPADYYILVVARNKKEATAFQLLIDAFPES